MCDLDPPGGFTSRMPHIIYVAPHATGTGASPSDPMNAAVGIPGVRGGGTVRLLDGSYLTAYTVRSLTATVEAADGHTPTLLYTPTGPAGVTVDLPALSTINPLAGPVSSGTGPTVTVPMTGLTCRTPAGCSAPTHPCPKFGAFVVRSTATWVAP